MQIAPRTKDEWVAFVLLPAKVFALAFALLVCSSLGIDSGNRQFDAIISLCLLLAWPTLLFGALLQAIFCKRGQATQTLIFCAVPAFVLMASGITRGGNSPAGGIILLAAMAWVMWRWIKINNRSKEKKPETECTCLVCQAAIPIDGKVCPECGWSFEKIANKQ